MTLSKEKTAYSVGAEPQSTPESVCVIHNNSIPLSSRKSKTFASIDGETLLSTPLPPLRFVIDTLLPQGLSILAGAPKVGKSWLALQICLAVAKGESLWGLATTKVGALYLCLEDSFARIQSRLFDMGDNAPANVHFVILADGIGTGLEEQVENFLIAHPDTALIVIDTLQKVRSLTNDNAYAADYHDIGLIKTLADKHSIAMLLIHHLRKQSDNDPMNMVSGTTGITGAVDNSFVLKESKRGSGRATLYCTGRDIEYREMELSQDKQTHCWNLESDSMENPAVLLDDMVRIFAEFLAEEKSFTGSPTALAQRIEDTTGHHFSAATLSKKLLQSQRELSEMGIEYSSKAGNGKRTVTAQYRDGSVGSYGKSEIPPYPQTAVSAVTAVTENG
jgi:hypothetical protein